MARRVYMDTGTIRVSKPGYDAVTAALSQLHLFLGARYGQVIVKGYVQAGVSGGNYVAAAYFPFSSQYVDAMVFSIVKRPFAQFPTYIEYTTPSARPAVFDYDPNGYLITYQNLNTTFNIDYANSQITFSRSTSTPNQEVVEGFSYCVFRKPLGA